MSHRNRGDGVEGERFLRWNLVNIYILPWLLRWEIISLQCRRRRLNSWVRKIPWRREWLPNLVFLPGEFYGQWSLVGYNIWGLKESDMTE